MRVLLVVRNKDSLTYVGGASIEYAAWTALPDSSEQRKMCLESSSVMISPIMAGIAH
jgi:hypothetical protein